MTICKIPFVPGAPPEALGAPPEDVKPRPVLLHLGGRSDFPAEVCGTAQRLCRLVQVLVGAGAERILTEARLPLDDVAEHARCASDHNPNGTGLASSRIGGAICSFFEARRRNQGCRNVAFLTA